MNKFRVTPFLTILLCACSTTVPPTDTEFPTPLVEDLPAAVGIYYDDELRNFTYNETVSDGTSWTIELGQSNLRLFDRLLGAMFDRTVQLRSIDDVRNDPTLDGVIRPVLEEYAFLTPNELGSRFYAVSIRYRIYLYDNQGNEIADWPINAYGQSRAAVLNAGRMRVGPLQDATNLAMRDAAAGAIILLREQPEIMALTTEGTADDAAMFSE
ncbi:MAG: hypothetical protein KJO55_10510 [Gammaproteobacteria bacterium]|nr:hypothetical protein [Gammaproteobacteria bacterium]NND60984.1 hypothetical protein [Gammaproteobacteria bacterium]